jgi:hypothetical protein
LVGVEANQKTVETVKLLLIPGQTPDLEGAPALTKPGEEQASAVALSAPTWIFGGVALAAGAAATIFGVIANRQESALTSGFDAMTGVYRGTRAQAFEQTRNATIANVSFIALGVTALATAVFLIIDLVSGSSPAPAPAGSAP